MKSIDTRDWQTFVAALLELLHQRAQRYSAQLTAGIADEDQRRSAERILAKVRRVLRRSRHIQ